MHQAEKYQDRDIQDSHTQVQIKAFLKLKVAHCPYWRVGEFHDSLDLNNAGVESTAGIEYFPNLRSLYIENNGIEFRNFVHKLLGLTELLDVEQLSAIRELYVMVLLV